MNPPQSDLIQLEPDNLFGTEGVLTYTEFSREFSGQFDAAGEPVFVRTENPQRVPIVRSHPGQAFEGYWVLHETLPYVVLDTKGFKLAFACQAPLPRSAALRNEPVLRIEAIEAAATIHQRTSTWRISELVPHKPDEVMESRRLAPEPVAPTQTEIVHEAPLGVPLATAVDYVTDELVWVSKQRLALNPDVEGRFSVASARLQAARDVLGRDYRTALEEERILPGLQHALGAASTRLRGQQLAELDVAVAEFQAGSPQRARLFHQMAEAVCHPTLKQAIHEQGEKLLRRHRELQFRLERLERFRTNLLAQAAKVGQSIGTGLSPATDIGALKPSAALAPSPSTHPEPKPSAQIQPPKPNRLRPHF